MLNTKSNANYVFGVLDYVFMEESSLIPREDYRNSTAYLQLLRQNNTENKRIPYSKTLNCIISYFKENAIKEPNSEVLCIIDMQLYFKEIDYFYIITKTKKYKTKKEYLFETIKEIISSYNNYKDFVKFRTFIEYKIMHLSDFENFYKTSFLEEYLIEYCNTIDTYPFQVERSNRQQLNSLKNTLNHIMDYNIEVWLFLSMYELIDQIIAHKSNSEASIHSKCSKILNNYKHYSVHCLKKIIKKEPYITWDVDIYQKIYLIKYVSKVLIEDSRFVLFVETCLNNQIIMPEMFCYSKDIIFFENYEVKHLPKSDLKKWQNILNTKTKLFIHLCYYAQGYFEGVERETLDIIFRK